MKKSNLLLSLTFVPTVTALAISCSSNGNTNIAQKNQTTIKGNIQASEFGLENKLASTAINDINENFIFNNINKFLMGDYNLSSNSQIVSINKTSSDDEGSISLSFQLAPETWYNANGQLGKTQSSVFSTKINGFKLPTIIKTETRIKDIVQASDLGLANELASSALNTINNDFIYNNISKFLLNDYNVSSSIQITAINKTVQQDQTSISLSFNLPQSAWYDANGEIGTTEKTFTTTIQGFKPTTITTLNFKDQRFYNWGDPNIDTLNSSVIDEYLKNKIIQNRSSFLNIPNDAKYNEQFFKTNLSITNYGKNNLNGFITASVQINDNNSIIEKNICIKGFKKFDESSIVYPTVQNPTSPTDAEFEAEVKFWTDMPLGLSKTFFTQDELNQINGEDLLYMLIDLRTNKTPLPLLEGTTDVQTFDYIIENVTVDTTNNLIKTTFYIWDIYDSTKYRSVEKNFPYKLFTSTDQSRRDIVDKLNNAIKIVPKNEAYKGIKAKLFSRYDSTQIQQYFELNNNEIYDLFWIEPEFDNVTKIFYTSEKFYNFKNPTELNFDIQVEYKGYPEIGKNKIQTVSGFKNVQTIGTLDTLPIVNLKTPQGAISYKGELEKYYFDEFITTTRDNYDDYLKKLTYEDIKKELMYHIRFYLYQMFSDNYSEINYYIIEDDANNHRFTAIGEGIIKEDRADVYYGFQPHIASIGVNHTSSVKKGDKIRIELKFYPTGEAFRPWAFERGAGKPGDLTYSWYWDYGNKCVGYVNSSSPFFKDDIPKSIFYVRYWGVSINGISTISSRISNYGAPILAIPFMILKTSK